MNEEELEKKLDAEVHKKACMMFGGMRLLGEWKLDNDLKVVPLHEQSSRESDV